MAGFSTSLSDMKQDAYELEVITSKLRKKSGTLDRLSVKAQAHSRNAGRQIANVNRQLGEEVKMISKMSETLQCIAGLYDKAEKSVEYGYEGSVLTVMDSLMESFGIMDGGIKAISIEGWREQFAKIWENPYKFLGSNPDVWKNNDLLQLLGPLICSLLGTGKDEDSIVSKYWDTLSYYIGGKTERYFENVIEADNAAEVVVDWYDFLMDDVYGDFDTMVSLWRNLEEERTFKKPELKGGLFDFFDTLSGCGILIDAAKEIKSAYENGDWGEAYKNIGFDVFGKIVKEGNKYLDKRDNLKYLGFDKQRQSILINTIISMPKTWVEKIEDYAKNGNGTTGTIVTEVVVGSLVESAGKAFSPIYNVTTALTYPVIDEICEAFEYDLSGEYERLTGESGLKAVFAAQKELWVDIVYEGVKENIAEGVDKMYEFAADAGEWIADTAHDVGNWVVDTAKQGWNNFKSGFCRFFGG